MQQEGLLRSLGNYGRAFSRPVILPLLLVTGCTSFEGMPRPVIDVAKAAAIPANYQYDAILAAIASETDGAKQRAMRNRTIAIYIAAADSRYHEFRRKISMEAKGSNLGLETGVLALTSAGAIAKGAANELSAGAAFLTGTRTSLNKEVYFERTLPALLTTMDANRLRARTAIVAHMRDSIEDYPLELAFADLSNYELAASIDGAIQAVSQQAGEVAAKEERTYEKVVASCHPPIELRPLKQRLNHYVYGLAASTETGMPAAGSEGDKSLDELSKVAAALGVPTAAKATSAAEAQAQADAIIDVSIAACNEADMNALFAKMKAKTGKDVP